MGLNCISYSGMRTTLLGIMPYAGLSFATFETLKVNVRRTRGLPEDGDLGTPTRLACGGVAGLVAQSATYPLDIVRRRMQVKVEGKTPSSQSASTPCYIL